MSDNRIAKLETRIKELEDTVSRFLARIDYCERVSRDVDPDGDGWNYLFPKPPDFAVFRLSPLCNTVTRISSFSETPADALYQRMCSNSEELKEIFYDLPSISVTVHNDNYVMKTTSDFICHKFDEFNKKTHVFTKIKDGQDEDYSYICNKQDFYNHLTEIQQLCIYDYSAENYLPSTYYVCRVKGGTMYNSRIAFDFHTPLVGRVGAVPVDGSVHFTDEVIENTFNFDEGRPDEQTIKLSVPFEYKGVSFYSPPAENVQ